MVLYSPILVVLSTRRFALTVLTRDPRTREDMQYDAQKRASAHGCMRMTRIRARAREATKNLCWGNQIACMLNSLAPARLDKHTGTWYSGSMSEVNTIKQVALALFPVELRDHVQVTEPFWYRLFNGDLTWRAECYASVELRQTFVCACFNPASGDVYFWSWWDSDTRSWRTSQNPPQHIFTAMLSR